MLTQALARAELEERPGELVVETAPPKDGPGWVVTLEIDGIRHAIITGVTIHLRVWKSADRAIQFVRKVNPTQKEVRVVLEPAPIPVRSAPSKKTRTSTARKP